VCVGQSACLRPMQGRNPVWFARCSVRLRAASLLCDSVTGRPCSAHLVTSSCFVQG
jgi:hypothetical protein